MTNLQRKKLLDAIRRGILTAEVFQKDKVSYNLMKNIFGKISQRKNGYFEKFIYYGEVYILGSMAEDG